MNTKLEKLEKKIRELCPELMELSFGCRVRVLRGGYGVDRGAVGIVYHSKHKENIYSICFEDSPTFLSKDDFEIIGHPITLEACRHAIVSEGLKQDFDFSLDYVEVQELWKNFQPWEKQTKVHELLFEIFNIK